VRIGSLTFPFPFPALSMLLLFFSFLQIGASAATTPRLMPVGHLAELVRKDKSKKRQKYY